MPASTEIRIQIVSPVVKLESVTIVKRKLQVNLSKNTPTERCIRNTLERFCEIDTVKINHDPEDQKYLLKE
jgi:hypothetical protein